MGRHIMKTTIEIADDLFERAQGLARREKTTFRALTEQGLRLVLNGRQSAHAKRDWKPITRGGGFATKEASKLTWDQLRDEFIYPPGQP